MASSSKKVKELKKPVELPVRHHRSTRRFSGTHPYRLSNTPYLGPWAQVTGGYHPVASLSTSPLDLALGIMLNNRVTTTSETKTGVLVRFTFPPDFVAAARSVLRGSSVYQFRMSRTGTLTSGSGIIAITISTDLSQYNEGAALTVLFEECKLRSSQIQVTSQVSTTATPFQYILAFNPVYFNGTPGLAESGRLPGSRLRTTNDTTGVSHLQFGHVGPRIYGLTTDEGTAPVVVNSGGNGTWQLVNTTAVTPASSTTYFSYMLVSTMMLRNRS